MKRAALAAILMVSVVEGVAAQDSNGPVVGSVEAVKVWGYQTPATAARSDLYQHDDVFRDALVEAVRDGKLILRMRDETTLVVGSASAVRLTEFVYAESGSMILKHTVGALRFISGRMRPESYRIDVGVATIGVRGTDLTILAESDDERLLWVDSGAAVVTPNNSADTAAVAAGQLVRITPQSVTPLPRQDSLRPFDLSADDSLPGDATDGDGVSFGSDDSEGEGDDSSGSEAANDDRSGNETSSGSAAPDAEPQGEPGQSEETTDAPTGASESEAAGSERDGAT